VRWYGWNKFILLHVRPSVLMQQHSYHSKYLGEILYWRLILKYFEKDNLKKSDKTCGTVHKQSSNVHF